MDEIISKTQQLKELQAAEDPPEARATIPSLELKDLKREVTEYPIAVSENENDSGVTVVRHELASTPGIAYVGMGLDLSRLPLEDVALLPLFVRALKETGAGDLDPVALSRRIGTHTGGVNVGIMTTAVMPEGADEGTAINGEHMVTKLTIGGKATSDKVDELFDIMKLMLTEARLDSKSKVIEFLKENKSRLQSAVSGR